jgi:cytochrome c oxidase assembly protein subunit 16
MSTSTGDYANSRKGSRNREFSHSDIFTMAVFSSRKYIPAGATNTVGAKYRLAMARHPFLLFGLPFLTVIIAGSFVLTPATAIRYERHDRRVRQMSREEELGLKDNSRKVDMREEYYVSAQAP